MKSGEKTGYRFEEKPEFSFDGKTIYFSTSSTSFDIDSEQFDKFTVEQVLPEHPTAIQIPAEILVGLNKTARIPYTLTPANAQTKITWFNSDKGVISISSTGVVTALKPGTSVVKAQTSNGLCAECVVTVPEPQWKFYVWQRSGEISGFIPRR